MTGKFVFAVPYVMPQSILTAPLKGLAQYGGLAILIASVLWVIVLCDEKSKPANTVFADTAISPSRDDRVDGARREQAMLCFGVAETFQSVAKQFVCTCSWQKSDKVTRTVVSVSCVLDRLQMVANVFIVTANAKRPTPLGLLLRVRVPAAK